MGVPWWVAMGAIPDGERIAKAAHEVQTEEWWWVWEGDRLSTEVERVVLKDLNMLVLVPVAAEEEVLVSCDNVMIEVEFLIIGMLVS